MVPLNRGLKLEIVLPEARGETPRAAGGTPTLPGTGWDAPRGGQIGGGIEA